jgi:hypothetical protein
MRSNLVGLAVARLWIQDDVIAVEADRHDLADAFEAGEGDPAFGRTWCGTPQLDLQPTE